MKYFLITLLALICFISCEEDDICVDGKSPQFYLKFENQAEADSLEMDSIIIFRRNLDATYDTVVQRAKTVPVDSVKVSLLIDDVTETQLIISTSLETSYYDTLTLSYSRDVVFGSKACGYRVNYLDINYTITDNFFVEKEELDTQIIDEEDPHLLLYY